MSVSPTTKRRLLSLFAVPALMLALSSCAASPGTSDHGTDDPTSGTMTASDWRVAFAGCMREAGIDIPDPSTGGGQRISVDASNKDAFAAAAQNCEGKLGPVPPMSPDEQDAAKAESHKTMLAAARCLRDNGIGVADPKPGSAVEVPDTTPRDIQEKCGLGNGNSGVAGPIGG